MSKKINNQNGFTLIELVIVVAIIAILSGVGYVSYKTSIVNAEESVCLANRKQMHAIFLSYQSYNTDATMEKFLEGEYGDLDVDFDMNCPCGGSFYLSDDGQIRCTEHAENEGEDQTAAEGGQATFTPPPTQTPNTGGSSGGGGSSSGGGGSSSGGGGAPLPDTPTPEPTAEPTTEPTPAPTPTHTPTPTPSPTPEPAKVPGTDIVVQNSYWPQTQDYNGDSSKVITVDPGGVFEYSGRHYVVTNSINLTMSQAAYGPAGSDAQRLTGTVTEFPSNTTWMKGVRQGDLCKISDGQYAVYIDNNRWACNPVVSDYQWYYIPSN